MIIERPNQMVVTWSTMSEVGRPIVEYGIRGFSMSASGKTTKFVDGGSKKHTQFIHRVVLSNLKPNETYVYHCGGDLGWSAEFWFKMTPIDSNWSPHIAIFGDMGNENAQSLPRLQQETQRGMYDAVIHVGDFAYDMHHNNGIVGDEFMRQIETIAAYVPYMTCVGNHEGAL